MTNKYINYFFVVVLFKIREGFKKNRKRVIARKNVDVCARESVVYGCVCVNVTILLVYFIFLICSFVL